MSTIPHSHCCSNGFFSDASLRVLPIVVEQVLRTLRLDPDAGESMLSDNQLLSISLTVNRIADEQTTAWQCWHEREDQDEEHEEELDEPTPEFGSR